MTDDHVFKLLIIGDSGVGKSSLLMQFSDNLFSDTTTPTAGVDIRNCTVDMEDTKVKLKIWDTAGQERFRTITSMHYRGTHGVIFVYDVTNADTFRSIKKWLHEIDQNCDRVSRVLVGNKDDNQEKKVVPLEEAQQFADQIGIPLYETSAKEGKNVEDGVSRHCTAGPKAEVGNRSTGSCQCWRQGCSAVGSHEREWWWGREVALLLLSIACTQYV